MNNIKNTWVNKYKPTNIDDILLDENLKTIIKSFTIDNLKHIILYGDSGIGKTSLSHLIPEYLNIDYKEYNASDTRGINTINEILIIYKKTKSKLVIILDEADNLTIKAQELIINVMDNYPNINFIFTCNSYDYLLSNIMERCIFFHLYLNNLEEYYDYMKNRIIINEKLKISKSNMKYIIKELHFDIRMIINKLELLNILYKNEDLDIKKINSLNTLSCINECIDILNILFDKKKYIHDFFEIYKKEIMNSLNFIDFINILLHIFDNYELYKININYAFTENNIIDFLLLLNKNNIKLLNLYIYTDLQYYNILLDLFEFSRKILNNNSYISV